MPFCIHVYSTGMAVVGWPSRSAGGATCSVNLLAPPSLEHMYTRRQETFSLRRGHHSYGQPTRATQHRTNVPVCSQASDHLGRVLPSAIPTLAVVLLFDENYGCLSNLWFLSEFFYLGAIWGTVDFSAVNFKFEQQGPSSNIRST